MSTKLLIQFLCFILIFNFSCKEKTSQIDEINLTVNKNIVLEDQFNYLEIGNIDQNRIIFSIKGEYFFLIKDLKKPIKVEKKLKKGKGPDEFLLLFWVNNSQNKFIFYDIYKKKIFELKGNGSINELFEFKLNKNSPFFVNKINKNTYITTGNFNEGRFGIFDSIGNIKNIVGYYPIKDSLTIDNYSFGDVCQSKLNSKPDEPEIMACITPFSNLFEIFRYDFETNSINRINKINSDESINYKENLTYPKYTSSNKSIVGSISLSVTNKYIYVLFNNNMFEDVIKNTNNIYCNEVRVFDWKGNLVKKYQLENGAKSIYVYDDELYSLGMDENYNSQIYVYKIDEDE